ELPLHVISQSLGAALALRAIAVGVPANSLSCITLPTQIQLGTAVAWREFRGLFRPACRRQRALYGGWWGFLPAVGPFKRAAFPLRLAPDWAAQDAYPVAIGRLIAGLDLEQAARMIQVPTLLVYGAC